MELMMVGKRILKFILVASVPFYFAGCTIFRPPGSPTQSVNGNKPQWTVTVLPPTTAATQDLKSETQILASETPETILSTTATQVSAEKTQVKVTYDTSRNLAGLLCKPEGVGPFPAIVYNHGGLGTTIGGAPEETCKALSEAGLVGFSPIRRETIPLTGHFDDVATALEFVKKLDYIDPNRLGMIGFSRGGLLTYITASQRTDLQFVIIMASAEPTDWDSTDYASTVNIPVLILVAENDLPAELNKQQNLVEAAKEMERRLIRAGKEVQLIVYPPYNPHGHLMFFEIGGYWEDVIRFIGDN